MGNPTSPILAFWSQSYHSTAAPLTSTTKQAAVVARVQAEGLPFVWQEPRPADAATLHAIRQTHSRKFLKAVRTGKPSGLAQSQGFRWSPAFATAVLNTWAGQTEACLAALACESLVMHPVSGAHHAHRAHGGGFCTFNWLVGVVPSLPADVDVIILDLDAHFGDGTIAALHTDQRPVQWADRTRVFDISGGWGQPRTLEGNDSHTALMYRVSTANDYRFTLGVLETMVTRWVTEIRAAGRRALVVYQAGMDPYEGDHVGGITGMTAIELEARDRRVLTLCKGLGVATVTVLAGGYSERVVDLHLMTFRAAADIYTGGNFGEPKRHEWPVYEEPVAQALSSLATMTDEDRRSLFIRLFADVKSRTEGRCGPMDGSEGTVYA